MKFQFFPITQNAIFSIFSQSFKLHYLSQIIARLSSVPKLFKYKSSMTPLQSLTVCYITAEKTLKKCLNLKFVL